MNKLQINNMLDGLSLAELRELQTAISTKMANILPGLRVGMKCIVDHRKVRGQIGEIVKINRTRCKVEFGGSRFNVPMSMIQAA
jgi:hypothetical protein